MKVRWLLLAFFVAMPTLAHADEPKKVTRKSTGVAKPAMVPFRLTDTHHTLVRVKINGKGPFNFVVDTGCPVFLIAEPVGKKIGLKAKGWATLDKLELEGGLELTKVKARVETPFQIEGMNGMGLAGVELHGLMGYTVLAKFKMDFDYTQEANGLDAGQVRAAAAEVALEKGAKDVAGGGMDIMIAVVQAAHVFSAASARRRRRSRAASSASSWIRKTRRSWLPVCSPMDPRPRPASRKATASSASHDPDVSQVADVLQHASKITAGKTLTVTIERNNKNSELKITAGDGL